MLTLMVICGEKKFPVVNSTALRHKSPVAECYLHPPFTNTTFHFLSNNHFGSQCFNSVLESAFDSQVTKEKEVTMEPLAQELQDDLVCVSALPLFNIFSVLN